MNTFRFSKWLMWGATAVVSGVGGYYAQRIIRRAKEANIKPLEAVAATGRKMVAAGRKIATAGRKITTSGRKTKIGHYKVEAL